MKHIAIFQSDLGVGGIQKSLINILNDIDYTKCSVDLFLFQSGCFFDLPENENLHIFILKPYHRLYKLVYFDILRRFMPPELPEKEYDIAIDFNSYQSDCAAGASLVKAKKRVMFIHNDVEIKKKNEPKYRVLWHFFKGKYKYFDCFAAVSPGIIEPFRRETGIYDKEIVCIPNHIDTAEIFRKMTEETDFSVDGAKLNICTVGRLCHQKGYDILLGEFEKVYKTRKDVHLYFIGDGPDREKLEAMAREKGLDGAVSFLGNQKNPFKYMAKMDCFVLTSRYEGQGMVIWEAKALGLPIYISRNLEKYNPGIQGVDDIAEALISAKRVEKTPDALAQYNADITKSVSCLLELE